MIIIKVIKIINRNLLDSNTYIVYNNHNECVIIDSSCDKDELINCIKEKSLTVKYIILTHSHFDHIFVCNDIKNIFSGKIAGYQTIKENINDKSINLSYMLDLKLDNIEIDILLDDDDIISIKEIDFKIIYTPGHTNDSICIYVENSLFSGDTIFKGTYGRYDLTTGNFRKLMYSIKNKLLILDEDIIIYPGHGEETTIKDELETYYNL